MNHQRKPKSNPRRRYASTFNAEHSLRYRRFKPQSQMLSFEQTIENAIGKPHTAMTKMHGTHETKCPTKPQIHHNNPILDKG